MIYCTWCGSKFTRKEHLERHIPTHTNVKPHRCPACGLDFARRDLLQRHHSTYHEPRDPMEPLLGGVTTAPGRTPIACQNCASAKTGCDKRVPCSRCAEKSLPCAARFARRSSKAAARAAQASANAYNNPMASVPPMILDPAISSSMMDMSQSLPQGSIGGGSPMAEPVAPVGPNLQPHPSQLHSSPGHELFVNPSFPSSHSKMDLMSDLIHINDDFTTSDSNYTVFDWPGSDYSMLDIGPDLYSSGLKLPVIDVPPYTQFNHKTISEPLTASSAGGSDHTRKTSIMSTADFESKKPMDMTMSRAKGTVIREFDEVIAAENSWPLARCNRPTYSAECPRTGIVHLEALEKKCQLDGTWDSLNEYLGHCQPKDTQQPVVVQITSRTRDKMTAITQSFLQKALAVHRGGTNGFGQAGHCSPPGGAFNFIMLPPSEVLEYFLGSYSRSLGDYYPLAFAMRVDPNEMLQNNQASTLLVLLMIAQGAAAVPMEEARYLSAGLTETSRISLFDIIEKDVELSADPIALRCAWLFTHLGAWSGDKWQMDIAMGQRGMYLSMLKHAGLLEPQPSMIPAFNDSTTIELQWKAWLQREEQNRLVYNWVLLDIELSLFHDTAPLLAVSELQCPLPGPEALWIAPNSEQWQASVQSQYGSTANMSSQMLSLQSHTPSLFYLFQAFLQHTLAHHMFNLGPQQMRLLLHPLQSLLCHLTQMLSCFTDILGASRTTSANVTKASTNQRVDEVLDLLAIWYKLALDMLKANPNCSVTICNLILYHLISLNAFTNFPEIERLARKEGLEAGGLTYWELSLRHKRCIYHREKTIFHCGQVFRLLRSLPAEGQPSWWSTALYRVTLILWTDGIGHLDPNFNAPASPLATKVEGSPGSSSAGARGNLVVDQMMPEHPAMERYIRTGEGTPLLTRPDNLVITLENPSAVLDLGMETIEAGVSTRIGDGIRRKLATLAANWTLDSIGTSPSISTCIT